MNKEALSYIDAEFEKVFAMAIHGTLPPSWKAVLKMMFIAGMSAALSFDGYDETLGPALKTAIQNVSTQFGGRTIFPLEGVESSDER